MRKRVFPALILAVSMLALCAAGCSTSDKGAGKAVSSSSGRVSAASSPGPQTSSGAPSQAQSRAGSSAPSSQSSTAVVSTATGSSQPGVTVYKTHAGIPVLCYHDIMLPAQKGSVNNSLVMTTDQFDRQMAILKNAGYTTISFEQLKSYLINGGDTRKKVVLTFDDGYKTSCTLGGPILRKYGFKATMFIIAFHVNAPDTPADLKHFSIQYVSRKDLDANSDVFTYASHTYNMHIDLRTQKNDALFKADLLRSRETLGGTTYFAYPSGEYNAKVEHTLRETGFQMAFTTHRRCAHKGENLFEIPRMEIYSTLSEKGFEHQLGIL
ncbi:MAG: polysaccharide deacetylase family protein [Clostridia bacterium]|nr:polysaccharide deacetylase family protein [Clostridia bacterium]MDR3645864.1 polysaccharide deacetylase family protein [Clostridia bacterium]